MPKPIAQKKMPPKSDPSELRRRPPLSQDKVNPAERLLGKKPKKKF